MACTQDIPRACFATLILLGCKGRIDV